MPSITGHRSAVGGRIASTGAKVMRTALIILALVQCGGCNSGSAERAREQEKTAELLEAKLDYLGAVTDVVWYDIERNNVYIGFDPLPADWDMIVRGAALAGNQATDFGFHAWGCRATPQGWRPGDGPYHGEHTARYGRVAD